jgi:hypothetical protein
MFVWPHAVFGQWILVCWPTFVQMCDCDFILRVLASGGNRKNGGFSEFAQPRRIYVEAAGDKFVRRGLLARGIASYLAGRDPHAISNR